MNHERIARQVETLSQGSPLGSVPLGDVVRWYATRDGELADGIEHRSSALVPCGQRGDSDAGGGP